ncbi:hypothetical protein AHF37_07644 [Paragonimus kellicotti]|nr:hypothetical protein AHF37_07644 [Paragonimus kellicotti]
MVLTQLSFSVSRKRHSGGDGLHTFVLYLGPFIAEVTMSAYECKTLKFPSPPYPDRIVCPEGTHLIEKISFLRILRKVQMESIMWGLGTAIGELPPYFMARGARLSDRHDDEELEELEAIIATDQASDPNVSKSISLQKRAELLLHRLILQAGFVGILLCSDIVHWLMQHVGASDVAEAINLASRIASMGYLFCIDDHLMTVKNDNHTYYRFQTPFLYPSRCMEADTMDYAVYLCKRTMQNKQRLELAGFEAERLASLQNVYCHKWEFVYIQAEAEVKVDKKRDKLERLVLDSQERAYWDVHRPPPGCVNTTDVDMRKLCRAKRPKKPPCRSASFPIPSGPDGYLLFCSLDGMPLRDVVARLNAAFRAKIKTTKATESLQNFCDQYSEFDLLLSATTTLPAPSTSGASGQLGVSSVGPTAPNRAPSPTNERQSADKVVPGGRNGSGGAVVPPSSSSTVAGIISRAGSGSNNNTGSSTSAMLGTTASGTGMYGSLGHVIGNSNSPNASYDAQHESASTLNPWISDNPDYWNTELRPKYLPIRRIKRWSFSIYELLKDPIGLEEFQRWLEKEFSAENLRFWQACPDVLFHSSSDLQIPNPLFDLAGMTCGHFLVPFWSFFGATFIGKALIKVHLQQLTVIALSSEHHVDSLVGLMG